MFRCVLIFLVILFLFVTPVYAKTYSDTVNIVFDVLNGKEFEDTSSTLPGGYVGENNSNNSSEQTPGEGNSSGKSQQSSGNQNSNAGNNNRGEKYIIPGIPDTYSGSILERMQRDSVVSINNIASGADKVGTIIHNTATQWAISLVPAFLIIAAILMIFSSAKAVGFILMFGTAMFIILFAPEIVQIFLNSIFNIFN